MDSVHRDIKRMASLGLLVRNAGGNLIQPGVGWLIVLILSPILVRVLDKDTYATWMLLLQIGAYFMIADGAIQVVVTHFVSSARGRDDYRYLGTMLSSAESVFVVAGALAICGSLLVSWQFRLLFKEVPQDLVHGARLALVLIGWSIGMALPFSTLAGAFRAFQRAELPAIAVVLGKLTGSLGIAWTAIRGGGLAAMAFWWAGGNLLSAVILRVFWSKRGRAGLIRTSYITRRAVSEFLGFLGAFSISQFCGILITGLDLPIVVAFAFPSAAYYAVATTVTNMLTVPYMAIMNVVMPVTSAMAVFSSRQRMGEVLVKVTRYSMAVQIVLTLPLLAGMKLFLRLWVGSNYELHTLSYALVLVVSQFIRHSFRPYATVSLSAGKQMQITASPLVEGLVNLSCSLLLVQRMGALGVALGTLIGAISGIIVHLTVSMRLTDAAIQVNRLRLVGDGILRPISCALPAVLLLDTTQGLSSGLVTRAVSVGGATVLTTVMLYLCNFRHEERAEFAEFVRRALRLNVAAIEPYHG